MTKPEDAETPAVGSLLERPVGRLEPERAELNTGCEALPPDPNMTHGAAWLILRRGCYECAWGKVLGCWRCGGR